MEYEDISILTKFRFLNTKRILRQNSEQFRNHTYFINMRRLKIFTAVIALIMLSLLFIDYQTITGGGLENTTGFSYIFYSHITLLSFCSLSFFISVLMTPQFPEDITLWHKILFFVTCVVVMGSMGILTFGDILNGQSMVAYLSTLLIFSFLALQFHIFSVVFYVSGILVLLIPMNLILGDSASITHNNINLIMFAIMAWAISRYMFYKHSQLYLKSLENEHLINELKTAIINVKQLSGLLPICASCKKIRDDKGYWNQIESYIRDHTDAQFSHSICPECKENLYPELKKEKSI